MMSKMALILFLLSIPFWGAIFRWMAIQCSNSQIWNMKRRFIIFPLFMLISLMRGGFNPSPDYPDGKKGLSLSDVSGFIAGLTAIVLFVIALLASVDLI